MTKHEIPNPQKQDLSFDTYIDIFLCLLNVNNKCYSLLGHCTFSPMLVWGSTRIFIKIGSNLPDLMPFKDLSNLF